MKEENDSFLPFVSTLFGDGNVEYNVLTFCGNVEPGNGKDSVYTKVTFMPGFPAVSPVISVVNFEQNNTVAIPQLKNQVL